MTLLQKAPSYVAPFAEQQHGRDGVWKHSKNGRWTAESSIPESAYIVRSIGGSQTELWVAARVTLVKDVLGTRRSFEYLGTSETLLHGQVACEHFERFLDLENQEI
jgi:hypothetical protein